MIRHIPYTLALLIISGCSNLPKLENANTPQWQLNGKIGVWFGDEKESAALDWQQCNEANGRIRLSGPLGSGAVEITSTDGIVTLIQGGERRTAESAQQLAAESGWPIPVDALAYWVRGRAAPGIAQQSKISPAGQLLALQQQDWLIDFSYNNAGQLPNRINATGPNSRVVLLVQQWSSQPEFCSTR